MNQQASLRRFFTFPGKVLFAFLVLAGLCAQAKDDVIIGVLSHRGDEATLAAWGPTAKYLSSHLPQLRFRIEPLDFDEVAGALETDSVDFLLVNPGIYVSMEARFGVARIATMNNRRSDNKHYNQFGGVVFHLQTS